MKRQILRRFARSSPIVGSSRKSTRGFYYREARDHGSIRRGPPSAGDWVRRDGLYVQSHRTEWAYHSPMLKPLISGVRFAPAGKDGLDTRTTRLNHLHSPAL